MRAAWPAAVGPELARRTEVVTLDGQVLRIRVPDATWQRSLARMRGDLLHRLREIAGDAAPRSLGFVVGPASPATGAPDGEPAAPQRMQRASRSLDTPAPREVVSAAAAIPDPDLRRRFLAVAARYFERFSSGAD